MDNKYTVKINTDYFWDKVMKEYSIEINADCSDNESDEVLNKQRKECEKHGIGYDADMWFSVFIYCKDHSFSCIRCNFGLFGLNPSYTFDFIEMKDIKNRKTVYKVMDILCQWFSDKTIDDISESFYRKVENELAKTIEDQLNDII